MTQSTRDVAMADCGKRTGHRIQFSVRSCHSIKRVCAGEAITLPTDAKTKGMHDIRQNPTCLTRLAIDSKDRDLTKFPLASHYEITLDEAIFDVLSMTLVVADVPFVSYLINPSNNMITLCLTDSSTLPATIPTGDYCGVSLASAVQSAVQQQCSTHGVTFTAVFSEVTDNICFTCSDPFSVKFPERGSIAKELGFAVDSTNVSTGSDNQTFTVRPPFRRDSHTHPSCILKMNQSSVLTSVNKTVNQSFAILTPSRNTLCAATSELPVKYFNPPMPRLMRLTIDFSNYDGSPVDFQNHDHRLEVLLTSTRSGKYQPMDL